MVNQNRQQETKAAGAAWTYNRPSAGLSRGSKQGFSIFAATAVVLFVVVFVMGVPPESPRAIFSDFILAAGLSALGVWGVGGMIEISGTIRDLTVKAGGGIAIIVMVMFVFRPFNSAAVDTSYDEFYEIGPYGSIGALLSTYNAQFYSDDKNAIQILIPEEDKERIMNFRAEPIGVEASYTANWDILRQRNPRLEILSKIAGRQDCVSFEEKADSRVVVELHGTLVEHSVPDEDRKLYTCAPGF